jgi:glycosyltransferase involved in cell wall biosynthesis
MAGRRTEQNSRENSGLIKLLHVTTVPETLHFFRGQIGFLKSNGFEVSAVASPGKVLQDFGNEQAIVVHGVHMERRITPLQDLLSLARLCSVIHKAKPHIVDAHTPKGGLLGMIAAFMMRVPVRIYHIHGLPMITARGWKRILLKLTEKVSCLLANQVLCVSKSVRQVVINEGMCPADKIKSLHNGSINGVDSEHVFNPERIGDLTRCQVRSNYGIPADAVVIGFVGRIVRDKGLIELVEAWKALRRDYTSLHLLVSGNFEPQDPVPDKVRETLENDPRIILTGHVEDIPRIYSAIDIFALPTYREGFSTVCLEAAAMALPVVTCRVPGCICAVEDGVTGTLVESKDAFALAKALNTYIKDFDKRRNHGNAGRARVQRDFCQNDIWHVLHEEYARLLMNVRIPVPQISMPEETNMRLAG